MKPKHNHNDSNDNDSGNGETAEELLHKREKLLEESSLKKLVKEAVLECLVNNRSTGDMTPTQTTNAEAKINGIIIAAEDLAGDVLQNSRRIVSLGRKISAIETTVTETEKRVTKIQERAQLIDKVAEKFETRKDAAWEKRRDTILRVAVIVIATIAMLIAGLSYFQGA